MDRIVIAGGGQAGASFAARLRARGFGGEITLVAAEPVAPYQRPPLSKGYLKGEMGLDRLLLRSEGFWAEQGIALMTGRAVSAIDRGARRIALACGAELAYDRLMLATGARPRLLPASAGGALAGVFPIRTLADVDALRGWVAPGARALIVGGGYVGLEAAAVLRQLGLDVLVIEAAPRILQRVAAAETAAAVRALHAGHGVAIREGVALDRLTGAGGRVTGAQLADGTRVVADLVIVGIGILPETGLAEAAGLAIENGIAVDAFGRSSDPAILAAGDCASFPWRGRRIRLESVQNAIDQAEAAADALTGEAAPYDPVPWFWSDQYEAKLQIAGLGGGADRILVRPGARAGGWSHWYLAADRLIAVDALNEPRAYMIGKRLLELGRSPAAADLADPGRDLKSLL
jgi:3-phenylpropionate/trans-cinnamate dioxygenase ferredoxin reductase subunit